MFEPYQLDQRQSLPLESKIRLAMMRIKAWHDYWGGENLVVVDNGSMASRVLVHLSSELDPSIGIIHPCDRSPSYHPIVPFMVGGDLESRRDWLKHGCNSLGSEHPQCRPLSVWLDEDVHKYVVEVMGKSAG